MEQSWADWIRRSTHAAEESLKRLKIDDWTTLSRRHQWRWARRLAATEAGQNLLCCGRQTMTSGALQPAEQDGPNKDGYTIPGNCCVRGATTQSRQRAYR
eukprot:2468460-Pyramimonas_sp.AAC.1